MHDIFSENRVPPPRNPIDEVRQDRALEIERLCAGFAATISPRGWAMRLGRTQTANTYFYWKRESAPEICCVKVLAGNDIREGFAMACLWLARELGLRAFVRGFEELGISTK